MSWFKRSSRPVRRNGIGILFPVILLPLLFAFTLFQLRHIPDRPFQLPAMWETAIAVVLGLIFGTVMLLHTDYEKREDGLVYPKPNKNFKYILIAIIVIRLALTEYLRDIDQTVITVLAMVLALMYIFVWRIGSYLKFRVINKSEWQPEPEPESEPESEPELKAGIQQEQEQEQEQELEHELKLERKESDEAEAELSEGLNSKMK